MVKTVIVFPDSAVLMYSDGSKVPVYFILKAKKIRKFQKTEKSI